MNRGAAATALAALLAPACLAAPAAPLPPRRPPELTAPRIGPALSGAAEQPPTAEETEACLERLKALGATFQMVAAPQEHPACRVDMPVILKRLAIRYGGAVEPLEFPARPLVDCRLAEQLALWLAGAVAPILANGYSARVTAVTTGPGYVCRNRNNAATGKISAHALGLALDISGFRLADGRTLPAAVEREATADALTSLRVAACGWFTTVLGPGSDPEHADHLHVDIVKRNGGGRYRICE